MSILKQRSTAGNASMSLTTVRSKEWDGPSRWTEYLSQVSTPHVASRSSKTVAFEQNPQKAGASYKNLNLQWVVQLSQVGEGLLAKMYRLNQILDYPDSSACMFSEAFWKSGVIPNYPKICVLVSKKFPEHPGKLQLERVDKAAWDALHDNGEIYFQSLEHWFQLLLDLMAFREQALRLILDLSSTVITLLPHQNSLILHAFMDLFCFFVRVNLYSERIPRKMILQMYNILHAILYNDRDCDSYHRLVQFVDSYDPPLRGLHEDLNFVSPRIGEVLEAVGPVIFLSTDTRKLRNEGFLSPFHPRYPDILTNSAHPLRAQDLANVTFYREWALFGYLVCPDELLRVASIDIAAVVLKENLVLPLFRNEYVLLHEDYQSYVLPRILESKKIAKSGRTKQKEADLEYSVAKQVEKMLSEVHDHALSCCDSIHRERRIFLKQEIERMVLFFIDQPSLLAPNIQMVFSALAFAQYEVLWYFQHVGIATSKSRAARVVPVDIDPSDSTIGFLLDGTERLCCLVRKYTAAIRGYALSYLSSAAARIRFLLGAPGMVALDVDASLKKLFQKVVQHLENLPKLQGESMSAVTCDLSELRKDWLSILMFVTSARSSINIRHLEKATVSTGKEGMVPEGNAAYQWSRCIDELEAQLSKYGSLKKLYFYHQHLTTVFRNTMFGPEGRPQHCCSWLSVASSFPQCASPIVPEEITKIGHDAVLYVESLIESIMGGLEGLINILDSDGGFGSLEMQLLPEQAALSINCATRVLIPTTKTSKGAASLPIPGHESYPENNSSIKMLEAAMQRLTNLCSVLNDMEPICVLHHVFVLREYMRECIIGNFRKRLHAVLKTDDSLQRPSVIESLINRHISIIHLAEHHISMDLTQGIRDVLIQETYSGPVSYLHSFDKPSDHKTGLAIDVVCNWYAENIVKDISKVGILFSPIHKSFKGSKPIGANSAEAVADPREFKSFVRIFGGYGVDKMDRMMKEHTAALLNCIDTSLRSNREALESIAGSLNSGDRAERATCLEQIVDLETLIGFCMEAGLAMAFDELLAEAAGGVLEEGAPLIYSLLAGVVAHLPNEVPEAKGIKKMRAVCNSFGVAANHDSVWVKSIFEDVGGANDASWSLVPYLFAAFMTSSIWSSTSFNADNGGFNNNMHCLARCVSAVIAASESVRAGREQGLSSEFELPARSLPDASIKSAMQIFIKFATLIIFDFLNEANRSHLAAKLVFLDQVCSVSPYLPRTTLEFHIPYALLRSIYTHYHSSITGPAPLSSVTAAPSPCHSPAMAHVTPVLKHARGDASGHPCPNDSVAVEKKQRNVRMSGPLDYGPSRKTKAGGEGQGAAASSSRGPSPLRRFVISRSGPLSSHRNG